MSVSSWLGWWIGYDDVSRIEQWRPTFGAGWAHQSPVLVLFLCIAVMALSVWFYRRWQVRGQLASRMQLAALRGAALSLIVLLLAEPVLQITLASRPKPVLWLLFDGTDSMAIPDELSNDEAYRLRQAVDWDDYIGQHSPDEATPPVRSDYVRAFLARRNAEFLHQLSEKFEWSAFEFHDGEGVRSLLTSEEPTSDNANLGRQLAGAWTTDGTITALGDAFQDLAVRFGSDQLAGVVVFSDFDQNSGAAPLAGAQKLGVPIFAVGIGPLSALDLSVDLLAPSTLKAGESSSVSVTVRQRDAERRTVEVRLFVRRSVPNGDEPRPKTPIGTQTATLEGSSATAEFSYTPTEPGRFVFEAEVDPLPGEPVVENNRAERDVTIIDDFLRLLYVEFEPTWEWRFIKEVFHRDKLVGVRGFRTYLRSADPGVRETNELFLPGLTLPRSEFFQFDVIFLGDMPASALSTRFCEMTKEFVSQFGGGLVVLAGPRFGPGQLASTPLADMLPVVVSPDLQRVDDEEFRLALTPLSQQYDFMQLARGEGGDGRQPWDNLGRLPWYQPVVRPEPRSTAVLAEHPTDLCADGRTKQPLVAVRKYGRGEVVYLGFNEMWRLRRKYGEEYYRQFWGQMIYRLGLSHALGGQKRFVVRTDKPKYRAGDEALITVEAFDQEFQPLDERSLAQGRLTAELAVRERDGTAETRQSIAVPQLRPGLFEARLPMRAEGDYRIRVTDPVDQTTAEVRCEVAGLSVERRSAVRNAALQRRLAAETGGKAYDLTDVASFPQEFTPPLRKEQTIEVVPLWNPWLSFMAVIGMMLAEWFGRKRMNLA